MKDDEKYILAMLRLDRANELLIESKELLEKEKYKSANNRAFYSIEKSLNALLILEGITAKTHVGCINQFNKIYVFEKNVGFEIDDYKAALSAEKIRTESDYDDFYIANKDETKSQIDTAEQIYIKAKKYIDSIQTR